MLSSNLLLAAVVAPVPGWLLIPFFGLLAAVALGPLFFAAFWNRFHRHVAVGLGLAMLAWYALGRHDVATPVETLAEYASFAALLTALYVIGGTFYLNVNVVATPARNLLLLGAGAVLASLIGTTGASVLLIRPLIRLNDGRARAYQIVFFIFIVSNAGGLLTPLGDPPLFLGYLRGVPFGWMLRHLWPYWLLTNGLLLALFWWRDRREPYPGRLSRSEQRRLVRDGHLPVFTFNGWQGVPWLLIAVGAIFLDPARLPEVPAIRFGEVKISFVREALQLGAAFICYRRASAKALRANHFTWGPILEVVFLFFGIFLTMMPALQAAREAVANPQLAGLITPGPLYWLTGTLSAFLDNAPTYANFLALAMARHHLGYHVGAEVLQFAEGAATAPLLTAISAGAVLFGALTYIGNGPNLLVQAVAEKEGVPMPSFLGYIGRFALPYLLPVLAVASLLLVR